MSRQILRDNRFNIIGYIDTKVDGSLIGRDASNNIKGYYDPKINKTRDSKFNIVGEGNLLGMLITMR